MAFVVTESCIKCKYKQCVGVCPTDAFREGPNFLAIEPDDCIDCTSCVAECPVDAIFAQCDVPKDQVHFIALNLELARGGFNRWMQQIGQIVQRVFRSLVFSLYSENVKPHNLIGRPGLVLSVYFIGLRVACAAHVHAIFNLYFP